MAKLAAGWNFRASGALQRQPERGWGWLPVKAFVKLVLAACECRATRVGQRGDAGGELRLDRCFQAGAEPGVGVAGTAASVQGLIPEDLFVQVGTR